MTPKIVSQGPAHCFAGLGNVLVTFYRGAPTAAALRDREPWLVETLEHFQAIGLLVVVDPGVEGLLPDAEFRAVSKKQADSYGARIHTSASAIEGTGLRYTLVRAFLRSLAVVIKPKFPVRFFTNASQAATFVASACREPGSPSASNLIAVVDQLRSFQNPGSEPHAQAP